MRESRARHRTFTEVCRGLYVIESGRVRIYRIDPRGREKPTAAHPPSARVMELDVRDDLRLGREPFSRIMSAVSALTDDDVLHLRAIFEPVPLFTALCKRGFAHESKPHAADDWPVWF